MLDRQIDIAQFMVEPSANPLLRSAMIGKKQYWELMWNAANSPNLGFLAAEQINPGLNSMNPKWGRKFGRQNVTLAHYYGCPADDAALAGCRK